MVLLQRYTLIMRHILALAASGDIQREVEGWLYLRTDV